eukprot:Nk52_evm3s2402 gene=Nk52_evmTU3s2402
MLQSGGMKGDTHVGFLPFDPFTQCVPATVEGEEETRLHMYTHPYGPFGFFQAGVVPGMSPLPVPLRARRQAGEDESKKDGGDRDVDNGYGSRISYSLLKIIRDTAMVKPLDDGPVGNNSAGTSGMIDMLENRIEGIDLYEDCELPRGLFLDDKFNASSKGYQSGSPVVKVPLAALVELHLTAALNRILENIFFLMPGIPREWISKEIVTNLKNDPYAALFLWMGMPQRDPMHRLLYCEPASNTLQSKHPNYCHKLRLNSGTTCDTIRQQPAKDVDHHNLTPFCFSPEVASGEKAPADRREALGKRGERLPRQCSKSGCKGYREASLDVMSTLHSTIMNLTLTKNELALTGRKLDTESIIDRLIQEKQDLEKEVQELIEETTFSRSWIDKYNMESADKENGISDLKTQKELKHAKQVTEANQTKEMESGIEQLIGQKSKCLSLLGSLKITLQVLKAQVVQSSAEMKTEEEKLKNAEKGGGSEVALAQRCKSVAEFLTDDISKRRENSKKITITRLSDTKKCKEKFNEEGDNRRELELALRMELQIKKEANTRTKDALTSALDEQSERCKEADKDSALRVNVKTCKKERLSSYSKIETATASCKTETESLRKKITDLIKDISDSEAKAFKALKGNRTCNGEANKEFCGIFRSAYGTYAKLFAKQDGSSDIKGENRCAMKYTSPAYVEYPGSYYFLSPVGRMDSKLGYNAGYNADASQPASQLNVKIKATLARGSSYAYIGLFPEKYFSPERQEQMASEKSNSCTLLKHQCIISDFIEPSKNVYGGKFVEVLVPPKDDQSESEIIIRPQRGPQVHKHDTRRATPVTITVVINIDVEERKVTVTHTPHGDNPQSQTQKLELDKAQLPIYVGVMCPVLEGCEYQRTDEQ